MSSTITEPNDNDVLCGRGSGVNEHKGNLQMRGFCVSVVEEYKRAKKREKKPIAHGVVERIRGLKPPGRFLKKNSEGAWEEIDDDMATTKVAAALRESVPDKRVWEESGCESLSNNMIPQPSCVGSMAGRQGNGSALVEAPGLCLLSTTAQQTSTKTSEGVITRVSPNMFNHVASANDEGCMATLGEGGELTDAFLGYVAVSEELAIDVPKEEQTEENLVESIFGDDLLDGPKFTEEDCIREKSELTEEEKIAVLSDLFGKQCEISQPKKKVAREEAAKPPPPLPLLLKEMRSEIDAIPLQEKKALVEAQAKSSANEFSDDRMELFLFRENMNAKLAARRFVDYWRRRRELFGPDKFHLPMTLNGALRDDTVALEAGVLVIVPSHDASGRPIVYYEAHRHTRVGYTRESLLRAIWYVLESVLEDPAARNGIVALSCFVQTTLWDYDRRFERDFFNMERFFIPVKFCGIHCGAVHDLIARILKPIGFAHMSKEMRVRAVVTPLKDEALAASLEKYGLHKEAIPIEMGGTCQYSHCDWLAKRRSAGK